MKYTQVLALTTIIVLGLMPITIAHAKKCHTLNYCTKLAEEGDAEAQIALAQLYQDLGESPKNIEQALKWLDKAARQGNKEAAKKHFKLTAIERAHKNRCWTLTECKGWALNGNVDEQYRLGITYIRGADGIKQDYKEASKWFKKAADNGHVKAQFLLGRHYYIGQGVKKDQKEAARLFEMSANQGNVDAQASLGQMYYQGVGTEQDYNKSFSLFYKAAQKGNPSAQNYVAVMFIEGLGTPKNHVKAYAWASIASAQGEVGATKAKQALEKAMSDEMLSKSKELASEYEKLYVEPNIK